MGCRMSVDQAGLARVGENVGYRSLGAILFSGNRSVEQFSTLPFADAVYYPESAGGIPGDVLPSVASALEEDIHLYQCRRSSAGWYLERLSRRVSSLMDKHKEGNCSKTRLRQAIKLMIDYHRSIEAPLELEAHCLVAV